MRLTEHVYLVGGGPFTGFGLTSGPDSHIYLIDGGGELALVDSGLGLDEDFSRIIENIEAHGFDPGSISTVAITHYHGDHAGGAAKVRHELGANVAISADVAGAVQAGDEEATGFAAARDAGIFPEGSSLEACEVDTALTDGDVITVGELNLEFVATPGHCAGHGSYLLHQDQGSALFTGDSLFWAGRILLQAVPDCDLGESLESIRRMASLEFEAFLPGHGSLAVNGGQVHAAMAKAEIDGLGVPKSLL